MMTAARGLALIYTDGRPVSRLASGFNSLGQGSILGLPLPIWLFAICAVITYVMLWRPGFGRHVYAIGGNEQAARVSGINISRVQIGIYTFTGLLAGLAASSSRAASAPATRSWAPASSLTPSPPPSAAEPASTVASARYGAPSSVR